MSDFKVNNMKLTAADLFPEEAKPVDPPPVQKQQAKDPVAVPTRMPRKPSAAHVLHVRVVTGCGGGPEKTILRSPRYIDASRYKMSAAYIYPEGDPGMCIIRQNAKQFGCPLYEVAETRAFDHNSVRALLELCRELDIDIWLGHDYKSNLIGLLLKRYHNMKLVTTAHGFTRETWRTRLYYHIDNMAMLGYDRVITVSPKLVMHCAQHGVNPDRLQYIPNAIDTAEYARTHRTTDAKVRLGMSTDRFAIGVIGRFSPEKAVDRAIQMMPRLLADHPLVELHLIGDGPERKRLEAQAMSLGVADLIHWWGWQSDARAIYESLDALVLPSRTEGLPNVVLEAMAMGVPVAATNVGGVSDLLDGGRCGIILDDDVSRWHQQISPLISNAKRHADYALRSQRRVHDSFSFKKRMESVMSVYDSVLGRSNKHIASVSAHTKTASLAA